MNIRTIEVNIYFVFLKSLILISEALAQEILVRYSGNPLATGRVTLCTPGTNRSRQVSAVYDIGDGLFNVRKK
ncbi:MAG: hypothetical protein DRP93_01535 [Candidatus Neomarinimicrobiota bacterium]|nr:MAG: hypothetical protein DRP93_01535 [Candidatus Neomarinimicrobiota bacterium]